jgi:hypothetical protein
MSNEDLATRLAAIHVQANDPTVPKSTIFDNLIALLQLALANAPQILAIIASILAMFGKQPATAPAAKK